MKLRQLRPQNPLAAAIATLLTLIPAAAWAGTVVGPGNSYTVNPGDPQEFWQVTNGASLIIAPGAGAASVQVDNATFTATGFTQLGRVLAYNGSVANISGGQMLLPSVGADAGGSSEGSVMSVDTVNVISGGR